MSTTTEIHRRAARAQDLAYDAKSVRLAFGDASNVRGVADLSPLQEAQKIQFREYLEKRVPAQATLHPVVARHGVFTVDVTFPPDAVVDQNYAADHARHFPYASVERRGMTDVWFLPYVQSAHPTLTTCVGLAIILFVMGMASGVLYLALGL